MAGNAGLEAKIVFTHFIAKRRVPVVVRWLAWPEWNRNATCRCAIAHRSIALPNAYVLVIQISWPTTVISKMIADERLPATVRCQPRRINGVEWIRPGVQEQVHAPRL